MKSAENMAVGTKVGAETPIKRIRWSGKNGVPVEWVDQNGAPVAWSTLQFAP